MNYDTLGNIIMEIFPYCDCGLTGGCEECNPFYKTYEITYELETQNELDEYLRKTARGSITLEEVRKITDRLPSLTKLLKEMK